MNWEEELGKLRSEFPDQIISIRRYTSGGGEDVTSFVVIDDNFGFVTIPLSQGTHTAQIAAGSVREIMRLID